jgi:metallophosphoesterase superfamily enzyme
VDTLRRAELRTPLLEALAGVDRLVLLGDVLELRHGPVREALRASEGFFSDLRDGLAAHAEVVIVPGNHDHELLAPWFERREREHAPGPLGLEENVEIQPEEPLGRIAGWLHPVSVRIAYPGLWLRDDVYATHGHYLDRHVTVPTFERLAIGVMNRLAATAPAAREAPDGYEAALSPIYAWIHAMARFAPPAQGLGPHAASARIWKTLAGESSHRPLRSRALRTGFAATIAVLNRAGLGPLRANISGRELRAAGLRAMGAAVDALGIEAGTVIFGHTHRSGPWPRDDPGEWRAPGGARLLNLGSWVYEAHFLTPTPNQSPYWPGVAAVLDDEGPPRLERLFGDRGHAELGPPTASGPG